jgi:hypothetical protein
MDNQRYEYAPLLHDEKTIRLLVLLPGGPGDVIYINILKVNHIDDGPTYSALSYTWGDPSPVHLIRCNDALLGIAENLFVALNTLRSQDEAITLWVDAICINQTDPDERKHQVRLMGAIYSEALKVLVWTGKGTSHQEKPLCSFASLRLCGMSNSRIGWSKASG